MIASRRDRGRGEPGGHVRVEPSTTIATDLLSQAITYVKSHLDPSLPVAARLRALWAAVVAARDLAASDVVEDEFLHLARKTGLARDLGRHADEDLRHVVRWATADKNPFK
jgi:hypothetical protein